MDDNDSSCKYNFKALYINSRNNKYKMKNDFFLIKKLKKINILKKKKKKLKKK